MSQHGKAGSPVQYWREEFSLYLSLVKKYAAAGGDTYKAAAYVQEKMKDEAFHQQELETLIAELETAGNHEQAEQIRYLLKRFDNSD